MQNLQIDNINKELKQLKKEINTLLEKYNASIEVYQTSGDDQGVEFESYLTIGNQSIIIG